MEFKNLLVEIEDGIAVVTINRPKALNALNTETLSELDACFAEIEANPDVKVLILTGSGQKSFVAGADRRDPPSPRIKRKKKERWKQEKRGIPSPASFYCIFFTK